MRKSQIHAVGVGTREIDQPEVATNVRLGDTTGMDKKGDSSRESTRTQLLEGIYQQYREELSQYLQYVFRLRRDDAADAVQTAYARLASLADLEQLNNPRAFLYTAVKNLAVDRSRRQDTEDKYHNVLAFEFASPAEETSPEQVALHGERLNILQKTIEKLPRKRRRIFLLNRIHGLSYSDIANREGMSESAVSRHVFRALFDCQKVLDRVFGSDPERKR